MSLLRLVSGILAGCFVTLFFCISTFGEENQSSEQQAVEAIKRFRTNIQFNKDGTVRLVRFSKSSVTNEMLEHLTHFPKLDYLAVYCPQVTDAGFSHIENLTNLDTLFISMSGITDDGLTYLKKLNKLERLYLADTNITDAGLKHIAGLTSLKVLSLQRTAISDAGLKNLSKLENLETLLLDGTAVTDEGLQAITSLKKLKHIFLSHCEIRGPGLEYLASLEHLEHLCLTGTKVTADELAVLTDSKALKAVELYGVPLTLAQQAELRKSLPKIGVYGAVITDVDVTSVDRDFKSSVSKLSTDEIKLKPVLAPMVERLAKKTEEIPHFQRHVTPLLGRLGCNSRSCHGSFQGRGGFRLSMFGYDFDLDHENLAERIDLDHPAESLILNKPTSEDEHEGGKRLIPGSWEQDMLHRWIAGGGKGLEKQPANFVRLEVTPGEIVFQKPGETAQLKAISVWSDGTREDVTCFSRFETKNEAVAEVTKDGLIRSKGKGDSYVITFYDNGIFSTQVLIPLSEPKSVAKTIPTPTKIDEFVVAKLNKLGIQPSELSTDEEFLRRVSLDLIGTLPTPDEIRQFTTDSSSKKRSKKINEILDRPAYITWWTTKLCDLTGSNAGYLGGTEMAQPVAAQWRAWIERRVQENIGWDKIVEGIILARSRRLGQTYPSFVVEQSRFTGGESQADFAALGNPMPHYWFRDNLKRPQDKALAFGYSFMGVRLDCAQCHKHPFDQWSKQDFESFTQFFTRIKTGSAPDATAYREQMRNMLGVPVKLDTAALRRQSYRRIAEEGNPIPWKEVYIESTNGEPQPAKLLGGETLDLARYSDPLEPLMNWLLTEPNHYFAKAFVNRIWANYFNVGIISPPDDLNKANPPSNKALLNYLVSAFIESGYDVKNLHRSITNSRTYQLSWRTNDTNRKDERNFSHAILRRLPAEVAIDALIQSSANDAKLARVHHDVTNRKIGQHPKSYQTRAIDFSLLIFGKPLRTTNCDCERQNDPTLLQSLYVRNDREMLEMLDRTDGWITQFSKAKQETLEVEELIQTAYLRTLSRFPSETELKDCMEYFANVETRTEGLRDVMWALLNTQEFITNH
jgi:hypothetical protein